MNACRVRSGCEHLARLLLGAMLLAAAAPKLLDPAAFAQAVANYRMMPEAGVVAAAWYLPWLEGVVGAALVCGPRARRAGAWALTVGLYAVFFVAQASAWARGLDIACGCFGGDAPIRLSGVVVRAALALIAVLGACAFRRLARDSAITG